LLNEKSVHDAMVSTQRSDM